MSRPTGSHPVAAMVMVWLAVSPLACERDTSGVAAPSPQPSIGAMQHGSAVVRRLRLPTREPGLSGLARGPHGFLWAVSERGRRVVAFELVDGGVRLVGNGLRVEGVPRGLDTESVAFVDGGRLAFGTESQRGNRSGDLVLLARVDGGVARVEERVLMSYGAWGWRARVNHGIEGLCQAAGDLVLGGEDVMAVDGQRWAPLARYRLANGEWSWFRLRLTSDRGKLSALACRPGDDPRFVELLAVERHYGVGRLLRFSLAVDAERGDIVPRVALDLAPIVDELPNLEGIDWRADGSVLLLVDNDTGGITGPNEVLVVTLAD